MRKGKGHGWGDYWRSAEDVSAIADWFGRVVVYEDSDLRGRRPGEMTELISAALTARRPRITIEAASGPAAALRAALALASGPGAVLLLHETIAAAQAALATMNAVPWPAMGQGAP